MGLDTVELVLEIEDAFSIELPDDQASRMLTVGDVHDFIIANTNVANNSSACLSAIAFYSLRRAAKSLGVSERLRPRDLTLRLLPNANRRGFWAQLQGVAELTLPKLRRPAWVVSLSTSTVVLLSVSIAVAAHNLTESPIVTMISAVITAFTSGAILAAVTAPFAVLPANGCETLRGLAESVLGLNFKSLSERYNGAHAKDVWIALRAIIVEQLGVSPDIVTPNATFIKDLGCD